MAAHYGGAGPIDRRTEIYVQDDIFMPDNNKVVRYMTSRIALQTCDEGHSWKYVTDDQRTWYWNEFVKKYRWADESTETIRRLWYRNMVVLYRRTIHTWRIIGRYPDTVSAARWNVWTAAWNDNTWLDRAGKNKANMGSEPAGSGTGISKHIVGSKTYNTHYQSMGTDPTLWDLYLHTHRRGDGLFVDERSRLVHQTIEAYLDKSVTPLDDGTIPDQSSLEEVNSMFKNVVGGRKKGQMYGCGSMADTFFPEEIALRSRGGGRASSSSHESSHVRETVEEHGRVMECIRLDLQVVQRTAAELCEKNDMLKEQNKSIESRLSSVEDHIRLLVSGMPQVPPTHSRIESHDRVLHGRGVSSRGRSSAHGFRDDRLITSSSRVDTRGKTLQVLCSYDPTSTQPHRFHPVWVSPSQDYGRQDDDTDDYGDGGDDGDDDET